MAYGYMCAVKTKNEECPKIEKGGEKKKSVERVSVCTFLDVLSKLCLTLIYNLLIRMVMSACQLVSWPLVCPELWFSTTADRISVQFSVAICGLQSINPNASGNPFH